MSAKVDFSKKLIACSSFLILLLGQPVETSAQQFLDIRSEISIKAYHNDDSKPPREKTYQVRCTIGIDRWLIESSLAKNATQKYYFDGTNVYQLNVITSISTIQTNLPRTVKLSIPKPDDSVKFIYISPGAHPLDNVGVNIPWLAYCSSSYLNQPGRIIPLPGYPPRETADAFSCVDKTTRFKDALGLPKLIELITDEDRAKRSPMDYRIRRNFRTMESRLVEPQQINTGQVRCRYEVLAYTNHLGWTIPTEFKIEQYDQYPIKADQPRLEAVGRLVSITTSEAPDNIFKDGVVQQVTDFRFRDKERLVDDISYKWTKSYVPPLTNDRSKALFDKTVEAAPHDPKEMKPLYLYILFFIFATIPLIAFSVYKYKKTVTI